MDIEFLIASIERVSTLLTQAFPYIVIAMAIAPQRKEFLALIIVVVVLNMIPNYERLQEIKAYEYIFSAKEQRELCSPVSKNKRRNL